MIKIPNDLNIQVFPFSCQNLNKRKPIEENKEAGNK